MIPRPKNLALIATALLVIASASAVQAQPFSKLYRRMPAPQTWTDFRTAIPTSDGGYIAIGHSYPTLTKLHANGSVDWMRFYLIGNPIGAVGFSAIREIVSQDNHGYVIAFSTIATSIDEGTPGILRVDGSGNMMWARLFNALDDEGQPAIRSFATDVLIDVTDGKFVVIGGSCSYIHNGLDSYYDCRPFIAKLPDLPDVMTFDWIHAYCGGELIEPLPDMYVSSLVQAPNNDLVAVGTRFDENFRRTPLLIGISPSGVDRGISYYTIQNAPNWDANHVTFDKNYTNHVRVAGTIQSLEAGSCPSTNPDCGQVLPAVAWTGRAFADPNNTAITFGAPAGWRTYRDSGTNADETACASVTGAALGEPAFLLTSVMHNFAYVPALITISADESSFSGIRYAHGLYSGSWDVPRSIEYIPATLVDPAGLLMGAHADLSGNGVTDLRFNLIRTGLDGNAASCQYETAIRSQAITPTQHPINFTYRSWTMQEFFPEMQSPNYDVAECDDIWPTPY